MRSVVGTSTTDRTCTGAVDGTSTTDRTADGGVATVWAALAVMLLLVTMLAGLDLGSAVATRHRAAAAADLAALAAAGAAGRGEDAACGQARRIAERMGGSVNPVRLGCAGRGGHQPAAEPARQRAGARTGEGRPGRRRTRPITDPARTRVLPVNGRRRQVNGRGWRI